MTHDTFVIAEAGSNHQGDFEMGSTLISNAWNSGCDAVKFGRTLKSDYKAGELLKQADRG